MKDQKREPLASITKNKFPPSLKRARFGIFPVICEISSLSFVNPSAVNLRTDFAIFVRPFRRHRHDRHSPPVISPVNERGLPGTVKLSSVTL
jgi:hypothetical protein